MGGPLSNQTAICSTSYQSTTTSVVYYKVIGTGRGMRASTCPGSSSESAGYDSKITVWCSCDSSAPICVGGNDDGIAGGCFIGGSTVNWPTAPGVEYIIMVHGFYGSCGPFVLDIVDLGTVSAVGWNCLSHAHGQPYWEPDQRADRESNQESCYH